MSNFKIFLVTLSLGLSFNSFAQLSANPIAINCKSIEKTMNTARPMHFNAILHGSFYEGSASFVKSYSPSQVYSFPAINPYATKDGKNYYGEKASSDKNEFFLKGFYNSGETYTTKTTVEIRQFIFHASDIVTELTSIGPFFKIVDEFSATIKFQNIDYNSFFAVKEKSGPVTNFSDFKESKSKEIKLNCTRTYL